MFVGPDHLEVLAAEHLHVRHAALPARDARHRRDHDLLEHLDARRLHMPLEDTLEVVYISHLARLGNTATMHETLPPIVGNRITRILCKTTEHEEAANGGAGSAFACVAVDNDYVSRVFREEVVHLLADLEQHAHSGRVMIFPLVLPHHILELAIVILPIAKVKYQVCIFMLVL